MQKIEWTGTGWYKEDDTGTLTKIAPARASHLDAEKIAGSRGVWYFKHPPDGMERVPLDGILGLLDLEDDW